MLIKESIILAGGLGTRLRSVVPDLPKCMAPVNGKPFITYVVEHLQFQGINKFIFALGYKSETFETFLKSFLPAANYQLSIEDEPLGTGGAVKLACNKASMENVLVANGDTFFKINLEKLASLHDSNKSQCTLVLKPMQHFNRYGAVKLYEDLSIKSFEEKKYHEAGYINGGMYALCVDDFIKEELPEKFSFEKDYLQEFFNKRKMYGSVQDEYFVDIGIPEDYERAQKELVFDSR